MFGKKKRVMKKVVNVLRLQQEMYGDLASIEDLIDLLKKKI